MGDLDPGWGLSRVEEKDDGTVDEGRNLEVLSGDGSAPRERAERSPAIERRLRDRWCRTLGSKEVAIALWVRSMAEAANARKPPDLEALGSPLKELTLSG